MEYPKTTKIKIWEAYLDRKLEKHEKQLLHNTSNEIQLNKYIYNLTKNIKDNNLYIPTLSSSNGNCLYESICYKITKLDNLHTLTPKILRNEISNFMRIYKLYPSVFPNQELTLYDMFIFQNEIDYIYDKNTNNLYEYTYDIMCSDLACNNSWERLPTELILMCASFIYDIKIIICHDNGYMHEINTSENIIDNIYLGLLGEFHYIPLDIKKDSDPDDITEYIKIYNNYMDNFNTWIQERIKEKKIISIKEDKIDENKNN
jgi:hypothetical protein